MVSILNILNKPFVDSGSTDELLENAPELPIQPSVTRKDLVFFLLFACGNNALSVLNYLPTMLQYLAYRGGFDPDDPTGTGCDITNQFKKCHVTLSGIKNMGGGISVSSMMLYVNVFAFFTQFLFFVTIGPLGDFGKVNLGIVVTAAITLCSAQFGTLALITDDGSHWYIMAILNFLALVSYNTCLTFFIASFPQLSDNLPIVQRAFKNQDLSKDEYQTVVDGWRNSTCTMMVGATFFGHLMLSCVLYGISYIPWSTGSFISNGYTLGNRSTFIFIATAICGGFLLICSIPYAITNRKSIKGPPFPKDAHYLTFGWISIGRALKEIRQYRQLFVFMVAYFLFNDALVAVIQMMSIIVGQVTHFSAQTQTLFGVVIAFTNVIGNIFFYYFFKRLNISPKTGLMILIAIDSLIAIYGCIGINSTTMGFRTENEVWVYYIWGFFVGPTLSMQQSVAASLIPKGKENMFFGLFGVASNASSWFGPLVIGMISQRTGNLRLGWTVIVVVYAAALGALYSVDMKAGALDLVSSQNSTNNKEL